MTAPPLPAAPHTDAAGKLHFEGLDALRFFAAMAVVFHHIVQFQTIYRQDTWWGLNLLSQGGLQGVLLFFVLSGFLITYLLLVEIHSKATIRVRDFYVRRVLRILPLYYLLLLLTFILYCVLSRHNFSLFGLPERPLTIFLLYLFFLPNFAGGGGILLGMSHTWSLGVEEQFYIIWPHLIKRLRPYLLPAMVAVVVVKVALLGVLQLSAGVLESRAGLNVPLVRNFIEYLSLESMAIGGMGAYAVYFRREKVLKWAFHPVCQILAIVLTIYFFLSYRFFTVAFPVAHTVTAVVFVVLILNVSCNPCSLLKLRNPLLNQLGRVSYGIYMYHPLVVFFVIELSRRTGFLGRFPLIAQFLLVALAVLLTFTVSLVSYHFFESPFLRLKKRYTAVPTAANAAGNPELAAQ